MILILKFIPAFLLLLGGILFMKFPKTLWNQLLYLFFKKHIREINILTGRYWLIGAGIFTVLALISAILLTVVHEEVLSVFNLILLYFIYIIITNILIFLQIKNRK